MKDETLIRLNKYLAHANIGTRRACDKLIEAGFVTVNNKIIKKAGYKIKISDKVLYKGELVQVEKKVYVLLNKPKNISSHQTNNNVTKSIFYLTHSFSKKLQLGYTPEIKPFDFLELNELGLTLLTNDLVLLKKLNKNKRVLKIYHIILDKELEEKDLQKIAKGFEIESGDFKTIEISFLKDKKNIGLNIQLENNNILHDIFEKLNYKIEYLDRTVLAGLNKRDLPRGKWRFLTSNEILRLQLMK